MLATPASRARGAAPVRPQHRISSRLRCLAAVASPQTPVGKPAGSLVMVPAYKGGAVKLAKGQFLQVVNTHGQQALAPKQLFLLTYLIFVLST